MGMEAARYPNMELCNLGVRTAEISLSACDLKGNIKKQTNKKTDPKVIERSSRCGMKFESKDVWKGLK